MGRRTPAFPTADSTQGVGNEISSARRATTADGSVARGPHGSTENTKQKQRQKDEITKHLKTPFKTNEMLNLLN